MLIFDGECGFCTAAALFVERGFRHGERAVPYQSLDGATLGALGLSQADVRAAAWWVGRDGRCERGHRAVGRALVAGGRGRAVLGWLCVMPPSSVVAAAVYRVVVRLRGRLPPATAACRRPGSARPALRRSRPSPAAAGLVARWRRRSDRGGGTLRGLR